MPRFITYFGLFLISILISPLHLIAQSAKVDGGNNEFDWAHGFPSTPMPGSPRFAAPTPDPRFPLRLDVETSRQVFHDDGGPTDEIGHLVGIAHFADQPAHDFAYTGYCYGGPLSSGSARDIYQAQWQKSGASFKVLTVKSSDAKPQTCDLKIDTKHSVADLRKPPVADISRFLNLSHWNQPSPHYPFTVNLESASPLINVDFSNVPNSSHGYARLPGVDFVYTASCKSGLPNGEQDYQARWLKPGHELEILAMDAAQKPIPCKLSIWAARRIPVRANVLRGQQ